MYVRIVYETGLGHGSYKHGDKHSGFYKMRKML